MNNHGPLARQYFTLTIGALDPGLNLAKAEISAKPHRDSVLIGHAAPKGELYANDGQRVRRRIGIVSELNDIKVLPTL